MLDLNLFLGNLTRWRLLAAITLLTTTVAFFLFGLLLSLDRVFATGVNVAKADRLVVANATSLMQSLPSAYGTTIRENNAVTAVAPSVFFGGYYQDVGHSLMSIATDPASFTRIVPEMRFASAADRQRWIDDPATIAIGRSLADKYGWKVGDLVPLYSFIHLRRDGSNSWTFRVAAIFDGADASSNTNVMLMHYRYLNEERLRGKDTVNWYNIKIRNPAAWSDVAAAIDAKFANSAQETKTASEDAFAHELVNQVGDFGLIVKLATLAVFFTLVLVVANTIAHSVSERVPEFATLKALGATDGAAFASVLLEGIVTIAAGAVVGAVATRLAVPRIAAYSATLTALDVRATDYLWIAAATLATGVVVAIGPAFQAMRVDVARHLRKAA